MIRRYQYPELAAPVYVTPPTPPADIFPSWYQETQQPRPRQLREGANYRQPTVPFWWPFYPNPVGNPEILFIDPQTPRGWPRPNVPICYIRKYYRYSTYPSAGSTQESPGTQPPRQTM